LEFQPAVGTLSGRVALMWGWLALLTGLAGGKPIAVAWLANPFVAASWVTLHGRSYKAAMVCSGIAVIFAASTVALFYGHIQTASDVAPRLVLEKLHVGYWLWQLCPIVVFLGAWRCLRRKVDPSDDAQ